MAVDPALGFDPWYGPQLPGVERPADYVRAPVVVSPETRQRLGYNKPKPKKLNIWESALYSLANSPGGLTNPVPGLFAIGAGLNAFTGGKTPTYSSAVASQPNGSAGTTYSWLTQGASGYDGNRPGEGTWNPPVVNLPREAGEKVQEVLGDLGENVGDFLKAALPWVVGIGAGALILPQLVK